MNERVDKNDDEASRSSSEDKTDSLDENYLIDKASNKKDLNEHLALQDTKSSEAKKQQSVTQKRHIIVGKSN